MVLNNDTIELLSVGDVCDRLMISESVAYRLLRSGLSKHLKSDQYGKFLLIP